MKEEDQNQIHHYVNPSVSSDLQNARKTSAVLNRTISKTSQATVGMRKAIASGV